MSNHLVRKLGIVVWILAVGIVLALPGTGEACPWCKDAPGATSEDENSAANAAAFNNSIYFMVGVPYFTFGVAAFLIYRGMKKNERIRWAGGSDDHGQASTADNSASL